LTHGRQRWLNHRGGRDIIEADQGNPADPLIVDQRWQGTETPVDDVQGAEGEVDAESAVKRF
jgi:hypothetical protein